MPFAAIALTAATATVPPPPLKPTGPWVVRAEESLCLLERQYPVGNATISLVFQPLLDLTDMELFVFNEDKSDRQYSGNFTAGVNGEAETYSGRYFSVPLKRTKVRATRLSIGRVALDGLKDGDTLRIQAKPVDRSFTIVRPDKARVALQGCIDNLKKAWGIDPEMKDRTASPLEGNPGRYFSSESYPQEAIREGIYGRVIALLNIDAAGAVTNCRVLSSAGQALNAGTCRVALRIRFKPARDMDGKPLPSTYILPVRWVLPGSES